jgi:carbon storage regulator
MLVLTRRIGETIVIDGDIRVTVVSVQGDKVRLGIKAPDYVRIDRQEIHDRRAELGDLRGQLVAAHS